ncbi:hypothetical protein CEE39_02770 [bacterium (candidate division B38) B3_B38]|nr:MAG: hypothetical protein CEE39_02770 [bacterium (candidate division B38) B3_B38]
MLGDIIIEEERYTMKRWWRCLLIVALAGLVWGSSTSGIADEKDRYAQLTPKYRKWLTEEVCWIITPQEEEEFLRLKSDTNRERFIEGFWEKRDPNPLTRENEYRDEHYQRLEYANRYLAVGSTRKGCLTDMGRVYILLGKPDDRDHTYSSNIVLPYEIWHYFKSPAPGLPPGMRIMFYRRFGAGEYLLFDPLFDRNRIFISRIRQWEFISPEQIRDVLGLEFTQAYSGIAPGYSTGFSSQIVEELRDPTWLKETIVSQVRSVPETGVVVDYTFDIFALSFEQVNIPTEEGFYQCHFNIEIPSEQITLKEEEDKLLGKVKFLGSISDSKGMTIARLEETAFLELSKEDYPAKQHYNLSLRWRADLVPGEYNLNLLSFDKLGRGQGKVEHTFTVDELRADRWLLSDIALGYKAVKANREMVEKGLPFTFGEYAIYPQGDATFRRGRGVMVAAELLAPEGWMPEEEPVTLVLSVEKGGEKKVLTSVPLSGIEGGGRRMVFFDSISTETLPPGEHTISLEVVNLSGELLIAEQKRCTLVDQPIEYGKFIINAQRGVDPVHLEYLFGLQYFLKGEYLKALPHLETAALKKPEELSYQVMFIKNLVVLDRLSRAEELVKGLRAKFPHDPQVLLIEATLLAKREHFAEALSRYEEVVKGGFTSAEIYNAMGMLYLNLKNNTKAREAFQRSLEIDPSQPEIKKLLEQIKGNYYK